MEYDAERNSTSFTCPKLTSTFDQTHRDQREQQQEPKERYKAAQRTGKNTTNTQLDAAPSPKHKGLTSVGTSYSHKNSNQNLYSKEVFIKYKDRNLYKRVVMKVSGSPRQKQNPSIPFTAKNSSIKVHGESNE